MKLLDNLKKEFRLTRILLRQIFDQVRGARQARILLRKILDQLRGLADQNINQEDF